MFIYFSRLKKNSVWLWMDGIEKQITWKKTWKTCGKKNSKKNLERSWQQVVCIVWGSKLSQVWILGYMSDIPPICWLRCCIMLENGWNRKTDWNLKNDSETLQSSKAYHTWFNFFLLMCCCFKCLSCWSLADAVKGAKTGKIQTKIKKTTEAMEPSIKP